MQLFYYGGVIIEAKSNKDIFLIHVLSQQHHSMQCTTSC